MGLVEASAPVLERCYRDTTNIPEVRLAALDTIRTITCADKHGDK